MKNEKEIEKEMIAKETEIFRKKFIYGKTKDELNFLKNKYLLFIQKNFIKERINIKRDDFFKTLINNGALRYSDINGFYIFFGSNEFKTSVEKYINYSRETVFSRMNEKLTK